MAKPGFVFLYMGRGLDPARHCAAIPGSRAETRMVGVSTLEEACRIAAQVADEGAYLIELCGAFGEEGARAVIAATQNRVPVGYVVHLPQQEPLFKALFG